MSEMNEIPTEITQDYISDVLADTITAVVAHQFRDSMRYIKDRKKVPSPEDADAMSTFIAFEFASLTYDDCKYYSLRSGCFLWEKHQEIISDMFLIQINRNKVEKPFVKGTWESNHVGLVLEDALHEWHFISPANYKLDRERKDNPFFTHITEPSFEKLMETIKKEEIKPDADPFIPDPAVIVQARHKPQPLQACSENDLFIMPLYESRGKGIIESKERMYLPFEKIQRWDIEL